MAGALGAHDVGGFQLSGAAAGGSATRLSGSPSSAAASTSTTGSAAATPMSGSPLDSSPTARATAAASVSTLGGSPSSSENWEGDLGTFQLGSGYLSGDVASASEAQRATLSPVAATASIARAFSGKATSLSGLPAIADSTSRSRGGETATLEGSTDADMQRGLDQLGESTLGVNALGGLRLTSATASAGTTTMSLTPSSAIRYLPDWAVEGIVVQKTLKEVRKWDEIQLTWRVTQQELDSAVEALSSNAGKVDVIANSDGTFDAVDRADGANTFTIKPPTDRNDVRTVTTWLVDDFAKRPVDQQGADYEVDVTLVPEANK